MEKDFTQEWKEYQSGIDYNTKINLYAKNDLHWNFYNSNQWIGIVMNGLSKWTFNICKSAINYFVSFLMSQKIKMQYSVQNLPDEPTNAKEAFLRKVTDVLSAMSEMKWENDKMDSKLRQCMLDGAVTGDYAAYIYWDSSTETGQYEKGDFHTDIKDGADIMFGDPNNKNVEEQPYILVVGRDSVEDLQAEAKKYKSPDWENISSDQETQYTTGDYGKIELENRESLGKALYVIKLYKKNGWVFWNKSTRNCQVRKDTPLGIKKYPIAFGNWETIKNSYHGMSAIEGIIDNQISINQMFALVSYWMRFMAFGKYIVDSNRLNGISNQLGTYIKVQGDTTGVVAQLKAGDFNGAILNVIDMAVKFTKEFIGASDALMGQIDPEKASGVAIISTAKQAATPLNNPAANRDQFVEDLGLIWAEFFLRKYKIRTVSMKQNGAIVNIPINTQGLEDIMLMCKVDVGPSQYWSEIVGIQALDRLFERKEINKLQYFERMSKLNVIPDIQGLIEDTKKEMAMMQQQAVMAGNQGGINSILDGASPETVDELDGLMSELETLPEEEQARILNEAGM